MIYEVCDFSCGCLCLGMMLIFICYLVGVLVDLFN